MQLIGLVGRTFGRLTVINRSGHRGKESTWECACACGRVIVTTGVNLRAGDTESCGCLARELTSSRSRTHGRRHTTEYRIWSNIKSRCYNASTPAYKDYGGRGIEMCDRWRTSFEAFYDDLGPRPKGRTLDRRDNGGHYTPSNCQWGTPREQSNNTRRNHLLQMGADTGTIAQWARRLGMRVGTLDRRLRCGWSVERALTTPVR